MGDKKMKCFLDDNEAVDSFDVESGNNAEIPVTLEVCQKHFDESEKMGYGFEQKYGKEILVLAYERLAAIADSHD